MTAKLPALILTMLCLLGMASCAHAAEAADPDFIWPGIPAGMEAKVSKSKGQLDILIDTYATDWDRVASSARKSGSLAIYPGIIKPEGADRAQSQTDYTGWNGNIDQIENTTENNLQGDNNGRGDAYTCNDQGWAIGRYDENTGLFLPEDIPSRQNAGVMVRWVMKDGTYKTERVRLTVRFTDHVPVYTKPDRVLKGDITPDSGISNPKTDNGFIRYDLNESKTVTTRIYAPDWLQAGTGWKAYLLDAGLETPLDIHTDSRRSYVNVNHEVTQGRGTGEKLDKKDWAIKWVDKVNADGTEHVAAVFGLEARFHVKNPKLTVSYDTDVVPVPAANVTWSTENPLEAFSSSYDEKTGIFHMSIEDDKLPSNGKTDLDRTTVSVKVRAPENATKCRIYALQGDVIYGDTSPRLMGPMWLDVTPGEMVAIPDLTNLIYLREIPVKLHNGKIINYYLAPAMYGDLGGLSLVLEWRNENSRIGEKKQQITLTTDAYEVIERKSPSLTKNPTVVIDVPTLLTQESNLNLHYAQMPQMGDRVLRYEFMLLDKNGNAVVPKKPVTIYLPYPDGLSYDHFIADAFVVYHQLHDGSIEEYSVSNGKLLLTPYGIYMEVSSFSPYFLNWEAAPDTASLPQTGDRSTIWLCAAMLGVSAAGLLAMKKRRRAS